MRHALREIAFVNYTYKNVFISKVFNLRDEKAEMLIICSIFVKRM